MSSAYSLGFSAGGRYELPTRRCDSRGRITRAARGCGAALQTTDGSTPTDGTPAGATQQPISTSGTGGGVGPVYETRETAADAGTTFDAGSVTVTVTVDVTYVAAA
jgi:hypothetical protein